MSKAFVDRCDGCVVGQDACIGAINGGKEVACKRCTNTRRPRVKVVNGQLVVLPLEETLRHGNIQDRRWWIWFASGARSNLRYKGVSSASLWKQPAPRRADSDAPPQRGRQGNSKAEESTHEVIHVARMSSLAPP